MSGGTSPATGASSARAPWETALTTAFVVALAVLLLTIVVGELSLPGIGAVHYKVLARGLAVTWLVCQLLPAGRAALPYRPTPSDLPLACFTTAAAASVAFGGGHWGDFRNLVAAIGIGLLGRSLFAPAERRPLLVALLGATVVAILLRELASHPHLLPPHETGRYELVTANPNVLGFWFAMTAPLLLAAAAANRGVSRWAAAACYAAAVLGTLLTFSRIAALGLAAGSLIVAANLPRARRALGVAALATIAFVAISRPDHWLARRAPGDSDRPRIMYTALELAREHPILGVGFGINNLEEHFPARYHRLYGDRIFRFHAANQLIDLLAGTGVLGTALALWWVGRIGRTAQSGRRSLRSQAAVARAAGGVGALVAIILMSMGEPPLYHGKLLPILFLVLAAIELGPTAREPEPDHP